MEQTEERAGSEWDALHFNVRRAVLRKGAKLAEIQRMSIPDELLMTYLANEAVHLPFFRVDDPGLAVVSTNYFVNGMVKGHLQKDFGLAMDGDCSLVSVASCLSAASEGEVKIGEAYLKVREIASRFLFTEKFGTIPLFLSKIASESAKALNIKVSAIVGRYGLADWIWKEGASGEVKRFIQTHMDRAGTTGILSVWSANHGFYEQHSMTICGWKTVKLKYKHFSGDTDTFTKDFILVRDNWASEIRHVDIDTIGSLHHILMIKKGGLI